MGSVRFIVVGLGQIGLRLAAQFADSDHEVIGIDTNQGTFDNFRRGVGLGPKDAPIQDEHSEVCVKGEAGEHDSTWMNDATKLLAEHLMPRTSASYEKTVALGITRDRRKHVPEAPAASEVIVDDDKRGVPVVVGEQGMFVADTTTGGLSCLANGANRLAPKSGFSLWRVFEGDVACNTLTKRRPGRPEREALFDAGNGQAT